MSLIDRVLQRHVEPVPAPATVVVPPTNSWAPAAPGPKVQLRLLEVLAPKRTEHDDEAHEPPPSPHSELGRVLGLPRVDYSTRGDLTEALRRVQGSMRLRPVQSQALHAARECKGLLGLIGVGHGKTLISALLPTVLDARRTVLLVPANLLGKTERDMETLRRHWQIVPPSALRVLSYQRLSQPTSSGLLEDLHPDLIIADEAHNLRRPESSRTKRFLRYFKQNPGTMFCALSGTLTQKSLHDYWQLARLALGKDGSPLPTHWSEVGVWDVVFGAMADEDRFAAAGAGARVALPSDQTAYVARKFTAWARQDEPRLAFQARLTSCPGVVSTSDAGVLSSLSILHRQLHVPPEVAQALDELEATWCWAGEEYADALSKARLERQLASGFYYRWVWPGDKDTEWLQARADWHRAVRSFLQRQARQGLDSPILLARACAKRQVAVRTIQDAWDAWVPHKDKPLPPVETIWLSKYIVQDAASRAGDGVILWYESTAFEHALREAGLRVFGPGPDASRQLVDLADAVAGGQAAPTIAASITAHGTGKNLQGWARAEVLQPPSSGTTWEQMLGRLHRAGQRADLVEFSVLQHVDVFRRAWDKACNEAQYQQESTGQAQRLCFADIVDDSV